MDLKALETKWRTALSSILDELTEDEFRKLLFNLEKIPQGKKEVRMRGDMPSVIIQYYGTEISITLMVRLMKILPRLDAAVQQPLRGMKDELKKLREKSKGMLRQLDYILVRQKWRNSILNAEPYSTFSSVGSDHHVVSMRVRLSLRVPKPNPKIRHDWKAFTTDPGLQTRYTEEVRKRFRQLDKGAEPSSEYRRFVVANEEAPRLCVPVLDRARTSLRSRHTEVGPT
ncbi:Craniofacial development protein 2 [Dissostichus eleginoides]|uniref:Craniofacial development protein 2 n=1 Tax=Dissostichus eleginoides TaxID=100907 RepID=A0AAD9B0X2_DISEL|nr:Craniofacial development protein 2 [Dissostichus eleginoides]